MKVNSLLSKLLHFVKPEYKKNAIKETHEWVEFQKWPLLRIKVAICVDVFDLAVYNKMGLIDVLFAYKRSLFLAGFRFLILAQSLEVSIVEAEQMLSTWISF